jgi:hypothetical protein
MSETLEAIGDRVSPERMMERRKAAIGQRARKVRDTVMGSRDYEEPRLTHLREQAGNAVSTAADRVQHAPEMVTEQTRGNPSRRTRRIRRGNAPGHAVPGDRDRAPMLDAAQPQMAAAAEELKGAGRDLAEDAKQHGQEAAAELKDAGSDAAASVTEQLQSTASGSAQRQTT